MIRKKFELEKERIYREYSPREKVSYIRDFYAGQSDNSSNDYLHTEPSKGWNFYTTFSYSIHIIDK